jgi:holo-[acyl-carrier protein] synthase
MKNLGIGIDIVDIKRFRKLPYESNKSFYKKIFSTSEIKYCLTHKNTSQHFAGKFAIKEAVKKSISNEIQMLDIITSYKMSKPTISLKKNNMHCFRVSLSHDSNIAVAVVISEKTR